MVSDHGIMVTCISLTFLLSAESPRLINFVSSKALLAVSSFASKFTAATSVKENEPPLLSSSSSNEPTSSHAGDSYAKAASTSPFWVHLVIPVFAIYINTFI